MKRNNKKGFTIVELVIVIAVIAILAGVLIPTFTSVVNNANQSAALQEATSAVTTVLVEEDAQLEDGYTYYFVSKNGNYWFKLEGNKLKPITKPTDVKVDADDTVWTTASGTIPTVLTTDTGAPTTTTALADLGSNIIVWKHK